MTLTSEQIDWIVAEVIRRLTASSDRVAVFSGTPDSTADLTLSDKVITLRSLENRLGGMTRLIVPKNAVVSPAAKDELKQRKIELVRQ
jgi:hypothetical protein